MTVLKFVCFGGGVGERGGGVDKAAIVIENGIHLTAF